MAAARTKYVDKELLDLLECCICAETLKDPRILPCIHTFCMQCLVEAAAKSTKRPGNKMPCPVCRTEFLIPSDGLKSLPKNFFMGKLIEIIHSKRELCDFCQNEIQNSAEWYCKQCLKYMCATCSQNHGRNKAFAFHERVRFANAIQNSMQEEEDAKKCSAMNCAVHKGEEPKIFCRDCQETMCPFCFLEKHNTHKWSSLNDAASEFRRKLQNSVDSIRSYIPVVRSMTEKLQGEELSLAGDFSDLEQDIDRTKQEVKDILNEIVDKNSLALKEKLRSLKRVKTLSFEEKRSEQLKFLSRTESFEKSCDDLLSNCSDVIICQKSNESIGTAQQLKEQLEGLKLRSSDRRLNISFTKTKSDEIRNLLRENLLGKIEDNEEPSEISSKGNSKKVLEIIDPTTGMNVLDSLHSSHRVIQRVSATETGDGSGTSSLEHHGARSKSLTKSMNDDRPRSVTEDLVHGIASKPRQPESSRPSGSVDSRRRIVYSRRFLLSLRMAPASLRKPTGFINRPPSVLLLR